MKKVLAETNTPSKQVRNTRGPPGRVNESYILKTQHDPRPASEIVRIHDQD